MTWDAVAHKDFQDSMRSRWLWGLSLFFLAFIGGTTALFFGFIASGSDATAGSLFGLFSSGGMFSFSYPGFLGFVLAFIALVTSYGALVEERDSGTLKLLLSLPHSRLDVVLGKLAGRSAVIVLPVVAGFIVALVALIATGTAVTIETLFPQIALTLLLAVVFISIGVGVSAAADSTRQATVGALGLYFLFAILWALVAKGLPSLAVEAAKRLPGVSQPAPETIVQSRMFIKYLNPLRAYETLIAQLYYDPAQARLLKAGMNEQFILQIVFQRNGVPFYLQGWFILLVLLAWIVVPPVLGYRVFSRSDL